LKLDGNVCASGPFTDFLGTFTGNDVDFWSMAPPGIKICLFMPHYRSSSKSCWAKWLYKSVLTPLLI